MQKNVGVTRDRSKKPNTIVLYDHIKGAVDIADLISWKLSVRTESNALDNKCISIHFRYCTYKC